MVVFGSSMSPYVRKVLAFAAEKQIEVEARRVAPASDNVDFRAASPFGKMPALQDGDFRISDSSAIVAYFEALRPTPNLIPLEPRARARAIWFDEFADTIFFACVSKMFFNRIVAPISLGRPGDLALAAKAETEELPTMPRARPQVIRILNEERDFLSGSQPRQLQARTLQRLSHAHSRW